MSTERELVERLRDDLDSIAARCTDGDKAVDWLPTILRLARSAQADADAYLTATAASAESEARYSLGALEGALHAAHAERDRLAAQLREREAVLCECANILETLDHASFGFSIEMRHDMRCRAIEARLLSAPAAPAPGPARIDVGAQVARVAEPTEWKAPAPDPAALGGCRRCSDCDGERHHWTEDPRITDPSDWACRHCDVRGVSCPDCELEEREDCELCGGCGVVEIVAQQQEPAPAGERE